MNIRHLWIVLPLLLGSASLLAQDDLCTALIQQTITVVEEVCAPTGRNQACYGNIALNATPRTGVQDFTFQQQGDLANVADIETLRLSSLDPVENQWGVALMKIQANLPDTLPGQNVTFLLFGDVEIQNAAPPAPDLLAFEVVSTGGINVRGGPSTSSPVIGSLANRETAVANGRNQDASWLRIQLPDSSALGWVRADLVTFSRDKSQLAVTDPADTEMPFRPMQAFYFRSGLGGTRCAEAPGDGILIQTPAGVGKIELRANDVSIQLGSTAFLQAQPGANMTVSVIEGQAAVTAQGATVTVPAGAQVEIPLDEDLKASGEPGSPEPYDPAPLEILPVTLLPERVAVAEPASDEDLAAASPPPGGGAPPAGDLSDLGSIGDLAGMNPALFCSMLNQALAEAGMSRQEYVAMLQSVMGTAPAEAQAGMNQVIQLISQCP